MRISKKTKELYENILVSKGGDAFYSHIISDVNRSRKKIDNPEIMILDQSEGFFAAYRSTGNENYFKIGKILRRIAHFIYRGNLRKNPDAKINPKFLNVVK